MSTKAKSAKLAAKVGWRLPGKRRVAAKGAKGGVAAARRDARVQALLHDERVHDRLRTGLVNARIVYLRATRRGDAAAALLDDRKGRRALRRMMGAFRDAFATVRDARVQRRRRVTRRLVVPVVLAGGAGALMASDDLRHRLVALVPGSHDGGSESSQPAARA